MLMPGAQLKRNMQPATFSYAHTYIKAFKGIHNVEKTCTGSQNVHAGCTFNFEHLCMYQIDYISNQEL